MDFYNSHSKNFTDQVLFLLNLTVAVQQIDVLCLCLADFTGFSRSPGAQLSPRAVPRTSAAKRIRSFLKCSKKYLYPALMSSGGFRALTADVAETVKDIWAAFGQKKKKVFL